MLAAVPKRTKKAASRKTKPDFVVNAERRRSTRVAGLPAKTYDENVLLGVDTAAERSGRINFSGARAGTCRANRGVADDHLDCLGPGAAEEVYTQKHVDALGTYEKEWYGHVHGPWADP